jgi:NADPH:quinone reductase-like Zn-dependent oxidoreductase
LVVRVAAAGVGPWDALLREGKSIVQPPLPIILGSDLAGIVDCLGTGVIQFKPGEEVFGGSSGASEAHDSIGIGLVNEQRTNRAQEL